jgi:WGR domain
VIRIVASLDRHLLGAPYCIDIELHLPSWRSVLGSGTTFTVMIPTGTLHLPRERIGGEPTMVSTGGLFGRALLARHWGRLGTTGRMRLESHQSVAAALCALATLERTKRRRGYGDRKE